MNTMMEKVLGTLRSVFQGGRERREVRCWVPECEVAPALVLAGTENGVLAGCHEHARRWVASDACRLAADTGGGRVVEALERWAEELGAFSALAATRPRNDVLLFQRDLSA